MTGPAELNGAIGLADFLSDLRGELAEASRRAEDGTLKLRVKEVTTTLDVAVSLEKRGEGSVRAKAKFWVFASAEAEAGGAITSQRLATQRITLTLAPHIDVIEPGEDGQRRTSHEVDVDAALAPREENPPLRHPATRAEIPGAS